MTPPLFPPWQPVLVPVAGESRSFPVRNVYGVTRNYHPRAAEIAPAERVAPAIIAKSPHWVTAGGGTVPFPPATRRLEPEVELVIAIGRAVRGGGPEEARSAIHGYAVGLDMTRRDLQAEARERRDPLDVAKWFEGASPISAVAPAGRIGHPAAGAITLDVNGRRVQEGDLAQMLWKPAEIVALLARHFPLAPGDVIFTGTPPGEVTLAPGDVLEARIAGVGALTVAIGAPA